MAHMSTAKLTLFDICWLAPSYSHGLQGKIKQQFTMQNQGRGWFLQLTSRGIFRWVAGLNWTYIVQSMTLCRWSDRGPFHFPHTWIKFITRGTPKSFETRLAFPADAQLTLGKSGYPLAKVVPPGPNLGCWDTSESKAASASCPVWGGMGTSQSKGTHQPQNGDCPGGVYIHHYIDICTYMHACFERNGVNSNRNM